MNTSAERRTWRAEFGLPEHQDPFVPVQADGPLVGMGPTSRAHVTRRACNLLQLDDVYYTQNTPLVYFKHVARIDPIDVAALHRKFWNHGCAPILAIIAPNEVHIYSGLVKPVSPAEGLSRIPAFVSKIDRASAELKRFLPAVESGEFLRQYPKSFDPSRRVDRDLLDNLQTTREKLLGHSKDKLNTDALDALLCRLVFICYLFDRNIIGKDYLKQLGLPAATHLTDVLGLQSRAEAKRYLYLLFENLRRDFNGDLFSADLEAEARGVSPVHIRDLEEFFRATSTVTGQQAFWPYDFSAIPIETVSAIYERFLKTSKKGQGAFYTPRFLAELILDIALSTTSSLLGKRYMDPACGSGIFLVGLFNRIAEEWREANPGAPNDRRAQELRKVLCNCLYGIDINPTACRITAFSLYLAYLDQLSPRDISELQKGGHALPRLVRGPEDGLDADVEGNIWCSDFFQPGRHRATSVDLLVGNPPWGSTIEPQSPAGVWCKEDDPTFTVPDRQIAAAFVRKAVHHIKPTGRICLVLPHGVLFNRNTTALKFQRELFSRYVVEHVLNLADYQRFLFDTAGHPAVVVSYRRSSAEDSRHEIQYSAPKVDWLATRSEVVVVAPQDMSMVTNDDVLHDLAQPDAPQIWKQRFWGTPRERRLIERLSLFPRLRDHVKQIREKGSGKPWVMSAGMQGVGPGDDATKAEDVVLPSRQFIEARSNAIDLFVIPDDCQELSSSSYKVRQGSNKTTTVFRAPHVLVKEGFGGAAYADFDVSFLFSIRGISGPRKDRTRLIFLAAYLSSDLARFFLFHTSSSWGISRQRVGVDELLRLPFPLPEHLPDSRRARNITEEVKEIVLRAMKAADRGVDSVFVSRQSNVNTARRKVEALVNDYFDVMPFEKVVVNDTVNVTVPSARPTRARIYIPTIEPSRAVDRRQYINRLCSTLSGWTGDGRLRLTGRTQTSTRLGIGMVIVERNVNGLGTEAQSEDDTDVLRTLERLSRLATHGSNALKLARGVKVFENNRLYVVKPMGRRFWTETAALNDADEIATSILMRDSEEGL